MRFPSDNNEIKKLVSLFDQHEKNIVYLEALSSIIWQNNHFDIEAFKNKNTFEKRTLFADYLINKYQIQDSFVNKSIRWDTNLIDIREYLKDGNASYNLGEHFWVLPSKMVAYDNDVLFLIKGKEYNFAKNLPSGYEEYVKYDIADKTVISIENNIIKGLKDGTSNITVTLGETKTGAITKTFLAVVKDLSEATDYQANANEGEAVINVMNVIVGNVIQKAIDDNDSESIDATTRANLIEALENGKNVDAKLDVKIVKESDLDSTLVNKIKKSVINGTVVEFLDIDLLLTANDDLIGKINKLDDKLTISIDAPESLKNIPANTTRQFFIVRTHEGEEPEVIEATLKDGKLIFQTDKFSNYAVGYADTTNTINPNTLDTINFYGILFVVSLIALYLFKCKRNA